MHASFPRLAALALALLPALAACGGGSGTGGDALRPDQVGAEYHLCSLTFTPDGGSPPALDVRGAVMDTSPANLPVLRVGKTVAGFELEYLKKGDVLRPRFQGSYSTRADAVVLQFDGGGDLTGTLLLPQKLTLAFRAAPRRLDLTGYGFYTVSRSDYERVSGKSFPNARDQISGTLAGSLSEGACS
ncbi:MAG: hypothetical protein JWM27_2976 [Gemmatimonadetes bacterium]|nr:hypothetical protein [Gemmatimonadota bacterium]